MTTPTQYNREEWLKTAGTMLQAMVLDPVLPTEYRARPFHISVGNCQKKSSIGECWPSVRSEDCIAHVFITPRLNNSMKILDITLHELIHVADDCKSGHKNFFAKYARKVGLEGKFTATTVSAGTELFKQLTSIHEALGDIPHAKLDTETGRKKQSTRQVKVECRCDFIFRTSRTQIERVLSGNDDITCPNCGSAMQIAD